MLVTPGVDTVSVTNVDVTVLGHGYVGQARDVLRDMHHLIGEGTAPEGRFGLQEVVQAAGRYWELRA